MKTKVYSGGHHGEPGEPFYLGIDASYSGFGFTLLSFDFYYTEVTKFEGSGIERLASIYEYMDNKLTGLLEDTNIQGVALEGYAYGTQMSHMLGELGAVVKLSLHYHGLQPVIVAPTSLKKYVTGKGTGVQKNVMLLNIYKKWGIEFTDDNAADSYALAKIASGYATTEYEKAVLNKLHGELNDK